MLNFWAADLAREIGALISFRQTVDPIARLTAVVTPQAVERHKQSLRHRHEPRRQCAPQYFLPHRLRGQNPETSFTFANQSHRTVSGHQKPRYPPVLQFSLNRPFRRFRPKHSWAHPVSGPEIGVTNLPPVATICPDCPFVGARESEKVLYFSIR
ncbi:MAG: hypothetical protein ACREC0_00990 [Methylocella sp.]